jgi:hypothetical protein
MTLIDEPKLDSLVRMCQDDVPPPFQARPIGLALHGPAQTVERFLTETVRGTSRETGRMAPLWRPRAGLRIPEGDS